MIITFTDFLLVAIPFALLAGAFFTLIAQIMIWGSNPPPDQREEPDTTLCRPPVPGTERRITPIQVLDTTPYRTPAGKDGMQEINGEWLTIIRRRSARKVPTSRNTNLILEIKA